MQNSESRFPAGHLIQENELENTTSSLSTKVLLRCIVSYLACHRRSRLVKSGRLSCTITAQRNSATIPNSVTISTSPTAFASMGSGICPFALETPNYLSYFDILQ